ncbi:unnamed protein product [Adineta ricciae]|uniref:DOMON domain-containing protein n=1 Tax=Adineta ricciae TaxID=249248 RepID=A0A814MP74_ADIRI|nr:unnamed protein product [Adineta ricciae]CAF1453969.1 unnamed protein product [Adineta ricciae]
MKILVSISIVFLQFASIIECTSSPIQPFATYRNETELIENVADLWWTVDDVRMEITFELHVRTTGWIALGIGLAEDVTNNADIGIGWIDTNGKLYFEDRHSSGFVLPIKDPTTQDWFGLQGQEENNWTAIQFKRALDTKDNMDLPIQSGTNVVLFAYGLIDPNPDITYHEDRRITRMFPLWKP